jgi:hypothetical protein
MQIIVIILINRRRNLIDKAQNIINVTGFDNTTNLIHFP